MENQDKVLFWKLAAMLLAFVSFGLIVMFMKFANLNGVNPEDIRKSFVSIKKLDEMEKLHGKTLEKINIELENTQSALEQCKVDLTASQSKETKVIVKTEEKIKYKNKIVVKGQKYVARETCYDSIKGDHLLSKACWTKIDCFAQEHKGMSFEIIPVIDKNDFTMITNDEYSKAGLALLRGNEARWALVKSLGDKIDVRLAFYNITTEDKRGVIIRAYK